MDRASTNMTIADYCRGMDRREIVVNKNYQRSDQVWPAVARSFLIETVLKSFPIPKLYLHQKTDLKTRQTTKEIVDGQQRSVAIHDFLNDNYKLLKIVENEELRGRKFSDLDDAHKQRFLEYSVDIDLFLSATTDEVIEVFRRMNSYTVPLNPEEQRHARFQGDFKWFVNGTAERLNALVYEMGIFTEKQLVRMADNKLITELCDSYVHGIRTTNKTTLDAMYSKNNEHFEMEDDFSSRILSAFNTLRRIEGVANTPLMKPYLVYSLVQAISHVRKPVSKFETVFESPKLRHFDLTMVSRNMEVLTAALGMEEQKTRFRPFVTASSEQTNVTQTRRTRFKWFCRALTEDISG